MYKLKKKTNFFKKSVDFNFVKCYITCARTERSLKQRLLYRNANDL